MKKLLSTLLMPVMLGTAAAVPAYAEENSAKVYVDAAYGDDSKDGAVLNSAVKTLERAKSLAREYSQRKVKTDVILKGGTYVLDSTFEFTTEDSGASAKKPVIYRSYYGEQAKLTVGKKISDFTKTGNTAVPESVRDKVYEADLSNIDGLIGGLNDVLYDGNKLQRLAQYPNSGYAAYQKAADDEGNVTGLVIPEGRAEAWANESSMYYGYWTTGYTYAISKVASTENGVMKISGNPAGGLIMNALCELDAPGEYYIDTKEKKLYYYPESSLDNVYLAAGARKNVISLNGAKNMKFENIDIFCTTGDGFNISNCNNITIYSSEIKGIGSGRVNGAPYGYGIYAANTSNLLVTDCEVAETAENGISVSGGVQVTLTPSNNVITNTSVHDYAKLRKAGSTGIQLGGVGATVSHCEVYNAPHQAITFSGNDHIIENNRIYNVLKETSDAGAIYCGRSWIGRGSVIKNNYIYNTRDVADYTVNDGNEYWGGTDKDAIYCDDLQSGITVSGNIVYNMARAYIFGGGSDNKLTDNIAIDCRRGVEYDQEGAAGWRYQHISPTGTAGGNIYKELTNLLSNPNYSEELWVSKYPKFKDVLNRKKYFDDDMAQTGASAQFIKDAKIRWGFVYDRVVHNNYYTGVRADAYKSNGFYSGEYQGSDPIKSGASHTFLGRFGNMKGTFSDNHDERYNGKYIASVDGMAWGFGEHENANIILSNEELGAVVTDSYEIKITGKNLSNGISRSTAQMGIGEDTYVPSYSDNEFEVNDGNRFTVYAAIFDGNGKLEGVQSFNGVYLYSGQTIDLDIDVPENAQKDWYMNAYIWDANGHMIPVAQRTPILGS